jgi:hypothetical protein
MVACVSAGLIRYSQKSDSQLIACAARVIAFEIKVIAREVKTDNVINKMDLQLSRH